ncbi:hypothetical protein G5C60_11970 [Streptomyces sp. HC44]|uniref:Uncharacterized protein n=1 Tax=Streptomyces scabichelini TaxID=2711217 RepID=A0A6G4V361_9ACTN|nr:hypothetical protein [Streptomyces scabichelini]NGO08320.1 hypothetical protein [Streptomyces scabichelini]
MKEPPACPRACADAATAGPAALSVGCAGLLLSRRPAREPDAVVRPGHGGRIFELTLTRPKTK